MGKRPPRYVPVEHEIRAKIMDMSKADLAEIVWDYAQQYSDKPNALPYDEGSPLWDIMRRRAILDRWNRDPQI